MKQRFRFSIRTLMLLALALAVLLGPVIYLRQCFKIRMAVNILLAQGHDIQFAHQIDADGKVIANAASPEPKWLDSIFGPRLFHRPIAFQQGGDGHKPLPVDPDSLNKMTTLQKASFVKIDDDLGLKIPVNLQELTIDWCKTKDLSFIENLKQLKALKLKHLLHNTDLTPVCSLPNLEVLDVNKIVRHPTPISRCVGLKALKISCKDTNELQRIIAPLTKLERLNSGGLVLDLDWVSNHLGLKSLKLTSIGAITDLSPLMQLNQLEELELPILFQPDLGIELVPFDFGLFKQAPNLAVERVKLNSAYRGGMTRSSSPIVSPEALLLGLTNADSIPSSVSIATLKEVSLSEQISDLTAFKGASLNKISGPGSQVKDLEALRGMPLETVNFNQTLVSDISPVANERLYELKIDDTGVSDLESLRGLNLHVLTASNTPIKDISMLAGMGLSLLDISNTPVSILPALNELRNLNLDHTSIKDIQAVSQMSKLERLSFKGTLVNDLPPTTGLKNLNFIDASDTKVDRIVDFGKPYFVVLERTKVTDLSPLADSNYLVWLSVSGCPVTDLSSLTGVKNLSRLNISYTPITDLSPILKLNIEVLDLSGIKATDFSVLSKLPKLSLLKLADLPLDRIPTLHPEVSLRGIDLGGTQIKDLSPLLDQEYLRSLVLPQTADFSQDMIDHWPRLEKLVIGGEKIILDKKPD